MSDPGTDFQAGIATVKQAVRRGARSASPGRRATLENRIDALVDELVKVAQRPDEPEPGSVVKFTKLFGRGAARTEYTYAAILAPDGYWYVTGAQQAQKRYTWDKLLDWLTDSNRSIRTLRVATAWDHVEN